MTHRLHTVFVKAFAIKSKTVHLLPRLSDSHAARAAVAAAAAMRMRKRKAVTERHERAYKGNLMALLATSLAKGVCLVFTLMKFSELSLSN